MCFTGERGGDGHVVRDVEPSFALSVRGFEATAFGVDEYLTVVVVGQDRGHLRTMSFLELSVSANRRMSFQRKGIRILEGGCGALGPIALSSPR